MVNLFLHIAACNEVPRWIICSTKAPQGTICIVTRSSGAPFFQDPQTLSNTFQGRHLPTFRQETVYKKQDYVLTGEEGLKYIEILEKENIWMAMKWETITLCVLCAKDSFVISHQFLRVGQLRLQE